MKRKRVSAHDRIAASAAMVMASIALAGCQSAGSSAREERAEISTRVKFDSQTFGVPASPRVTDARRVKKGGGRAHVGKPYKVRGEWYYPKDEPGYVGTGKASWYGPNFHGRLTANGEIYDMYGLSAAHTTFPLPSYAMVTNMKNGNKVMVRVNDRGPFAHDREIDLSSRAAELLDFKQAGTADVKVEYVGRAPLDGDDTPHLMATFVPGEAGHGASESVMVATADDVQARSRHYSANAYAGQADLPGVRPPGAMDANRVGSAAQETPDLSGLAPVPVPSPILSYAGAQAGNGAGKALADLSETHAGSEIIHVGVIDDPELLAKIQAVALSVGRAVVDMSGDRRSVTLVTRPTADADAVLLRLWRLGALDAFVERR